MNEPASRFPQSPDELRSFLGIHLNRLTNHACHVLGNRDDADDVVQEAVIRAYRMRETLVTVLNPAAYLFRMVNNGALDLLRRKNSRENNLAGMQHSHGMPYTEPRENDIIREEQQLRARLLLDQLPEEQAEVIRCRFTDELTFQEIAAIVDVPVSTVKSRFSYGMIKLRSMMKEQKEVIHEM